MAQIIWWDNGTKRNKVDFLSMHEPWKVRMMCISNLILRHHERLLRVIINLLPLIYWQNFTCEACKHCGWKEGSHCCWIGLWRMHQDQGITPTSQSNVKSIELFQRFSSCVDRLAHKTFQHLLGAWSPLALLWAAVCLAFILNSHLSGILNS